MKKQIIFIIFLVLMSNSLLLSSQRTMEDTKQLDKLFQDISKKRIGVTEKDVEKVENPFLMLPKRYINKDTNETIIQKITYTLNAIFYKKAKINGKWYKINDKINDYKLIKIKDKSAVIKRKNTKKELFIRNNDVSKITFSSK